ncbi:MAG: hypothetical protein CMJ20_02325 [Phycisphaeraceae bacterium]|nr:hypothetical protein [Phycisphaeraceae bacterium]
MATANTESQFDGPRPAAMADRESALESINDVFRISHGLPPNIHHKYQHVYAPQNLENVMIVKDGSCVVSSTGIWVNQIHLGSATLTVGGINAVTTLPAYRRLGLGGKVMSMCADRMKELGCHIGLLGTRITNWYRKLGWENAGTVCFFHLNRSNISLLPELSTNESVQELGNEPDDMVLESLVHLRNHDRLGGSRSVDLMRVLHRANNQPHVIFALRNRQPVAYLLIVNRLVKEWAGPGNTVAGLIRAWYESNDDLQMSTSARDANNEVVFSDHLEVVSPACGHELPQLFQSINLPCRRYYLGMILVLDPRAILDAFGHDQIKVNQQGDCYALESGGLTMSATQGQLAKLLFGPERLGKFSDNILPLPLWQWPFERV